LSPETIRSAIKIRTVVGKNGYEFLRKEVQYPLPFYRTLCNRVETLRMALGLQEDILDLLEIKTKEMVDRERDCVLILDEV
jgi:Transposase protein